VKGRSRIEVLWAAKWVVALSSVLVGSGVMIAISLLPESFQATSNVLVTVPQNSDAPRESVLASNDLTGQYAQLATSSPIISRAVQQTGFPLGADKVSVTAMNNFNILQFSVTSTQTRRAVLESRALAQAFVGYVQAQHAAQTKRLNENAARQLAPMDKQIQQLSNLIEDFNGRMEAHPERAAQVAAMANARADLVASRQTQQVALTKSLATAQAAVNALGLAGSAHSTKPDPFMYGLVGALAAAFVVGELAFQVEGLRAKGKGGARTGGEMSVELPDVSQDLDWVPMGVGGTTHL